MNLDRARRLTCAPCLLWLMTLVAFGLRVFALQADSLWYDEAFSVVLAHADPATALRMLSADVHPPLYYLALRAALGLFGSSEFAVRFVSLIPGVLLVPLMWSLARRLLGRPTALLAAGLVCLSPLFIWYAREARMYSQTAALGLAATYALVRAQDEAKRQWWIAFAACAVGAIYTHFSALYLVVMLGGVWLASFNFQISNLKSQRGGILAWSAVAVCVIVAAPFLLGLAQLSQAYWPGQLDIASALVNSAGAMVIGQQHSATPQLADVLAMLCGVCMLAALIGGVTRPLARRGVLMALVILVGGMTLTFAVLFQRPKFEPRHLITLAPSVWLLVATGLVAAWQVRSRASKVGAAIVGLALLGGLVAADAAVFAGSAPRDDWRGLVAFINQRIQPDETIILVSGHAAPALAYYDAPRWEALPNDLSLDVTHVLEYQSVAPALNRIQFQWRGVWLVLWQDEIVDPTQIVPALLGDIGTELPVNAQFTGVRLRHFALDHPAAFPLDPQIAHRLDQSPLPGLTALGFTLTSQPLPADMPLTVRMFWRADAAHVRGAAGGSLRVMDAAGNEWARRDELLGGPFYSERWPPNEWVMRQYTLTLPVYMPPGIYQLHQIVYRGEESGVLDLGEFVVTRPVHAPDASALGVAARGVARWGDLTLQSVGLDQDTLEPCEQLQFTAVWRTMSPLPDDYTLRLMFAGQMTDQPLIAGLPTMQWQAGDVWRTRYHVAAPCRALDGRADLQLALVDSAGHVMDTPVGVGAANIVARRVFTLPAMQHTLVSDLGDQVRLLGYDVKSQMSSSKPQVELTLYWQATQEMTKSWTVFTHVEGERLWGQHDGPPAAGLEPTDHWVVNQVVADKHVIPLDPATPPGKYRLVVGMYDPASLDRLPAFDATGERWLDDLIVLQEITVTR